MKNKKKARTHYITYAEYLKIEKLARKKYYIIIKSAWGKYEKRKQTKGGEQIKTRGKKTRYTKTELKNEILSRMDALETSNEENSNIDLLKDLIELHKGG